MKMEKRKQQANYATKNCETKTESVCVKSSRRSLG